ncbi:MAG: terminase, partial [Acutalibacter sp.]|nr:terminase [Acutalibacter sp.]
MDEEAVFYYAEHPVEFVEDIIGATPDQDQARILRSVAANPMTTVRSGHGVGKSAVEAWTIIWFLATRPFPKIPCTAPTQHQLFDILWAEVSKWMRSNPALANELVWTKEKVYMKGYPEEWFAVARTASKPDALQGFHAEDLLFIIDEASGVADSIFEPVLGALSTP